MTKAIVFGKHFELDKLPDSQLAKMVRKLEAEISRLEGRIDAIGGLFVDGDYLDPNGDAPPWFKSLCRALDRHRVALIAVEGEIVRRATDEAPALAEIFVVVCQEKMQPEVYGKAMAIAQKRLNKAVAAKEPAQ